jgi:hypothetical protein
MLALLKDLTNASTTTRTILFYGGLILLFVLLAFFLIFEHTFLHRTFRTERKFLASLTVLAYFWIVITTFYFEEDLIGEDQTEIEKMAEDYPLLKFLPPALEFTVVTFFTTISLLGVGAKKTRMFTGSWPLDERYIHGTYSAKRKVRELEHLMEIIDSRNNTKFIQSFPKPLYPVLAISYFFCKTASQTNMYIALIVGIFLVFVVLLTFLVFCKNIFGDCFGYKVKLLKQIENLMLEAANSDDKDELNYIIKNLNLAMMMSEASTTTIHLLTQPSILDHMTTVSKAILVDSLMKRGAYAVQKNLGDIIFSARGRKLTKLKNIIDTGSDYHNSHKLVFNDISDYELRDRILKHIEDQGLITVQGNGGKFLGTKTLSDVDDTLSCSGGRFPRGVDKRVPRKAVYPGALKL